MIKTIPGADFTVLGHEKGIIESQGLMDSSFVEGGFVHDWLLPSFFKICFEQFEVLGVSFDQVEGL